MARVPIFKYTSVHFGSFRIKRESALKSLLSHFCLALPRVRNGKIFYNSSVGCGQKHLMYPPNWFFPVPKRVVTCAVV